MNSVPVDPIKSKVSWLWNYTWDSEGNYAYIVTKRNWTQNGWFALMAKTEVQWWSNWVVCSGTCTATTSTAQGCITWGTDIAKIRLCETISGGTCSNDYNGNCSSEKDSQLRYLLVY